jgi:hypothetical protein
VTGRSQAAIAASTVLDELVELEKRGLVRRWPGSLGYKWDITEKGNAAVLSRGSLLL